MGEYINVDAVLKYIDGDLVYGYCRDYNCTCWHELTERNSLADFIKEFETADVAEVVRCRDCKLLSTDILLNGTGYAGVCKSAGNRLMHYDDYCSWGERDDNG